MEGQHSDNIKEIYVQVPSPNMHPWHPMARYLLTTTDLLYQKDAPWEEEDKHGRPLWPCDCRILRQLLEAKDSKKWHNSIVYVRAARPKTISVRDVMIYIHILDIYTYNICLENKHGHKLMQYSRAGKIIHPMLQLDLPWRSPRSLQTYHAKIEEYLCRFGCLSHEVASDILVWHGWLQNFLTQQIFRQLCQAALQRSLLSAMGWGEGLETRGGL